MAVVSTGDEKEPAGQQEPRAGGRSTAEQNSCDAADALGVEAARLAEAFSVWAGGADRPVGTAGATAAEDAGDKGAPDDENAGSSAGRNGAENTAGTSAAGCECGRSSGLDAVCRVCPICRAAAYVQTVRPEVLERVADVLAMIAGSLQAIAADQAPATPAEGSDAGASGTRATEEAEGERRYPTSIPVQGDDDFPAARKD